MVAPAESFPQVWSVIINGGISVPIMAVMMLLATNLAVMVVDVIAVLWLM